MKILLLEDDYSLNETIKETIQTYGHVVDSFYDGLDAYENVSIDYDLYILDINTPSIEGIDVLSHIKKSNSKSKVIMISAIIDIEKIREAYANGCDDYIKKPFDIDELIFKIEKLGKKLYIAKRLSDSIVFCVTKRELYINNKACDLTKNEKYFLHLLVENMGNTVTHEQIENLVYNGIPKSADAIRSMVKRLRKKIPEDIIQNYMDEGYFIQNNNFSKTT